MRNCAAPHYCIRIQGTLAPGWSDWLEGIAITHEPARVETILTGVLVDQAALLGVLMRLHELNLELISVQRLTEPSSRGTDLAKEQNNAC